MEAIFSWTIDAATRRSRQEPLILTAAQSAGTERQLAALDFRNEHPLQWCDFGMLCALDFLEHKIKLLSQQRQNELLEVNDILRIIAAEREPVIKQSLHEFYSLTKRQTRFRYRCKRKE